MTTELTDIEMATAMREGRVTYERAQVRDADGTDRGGICVFAYVDGERYPDQDFVTFLNPDPADYMENRELARILTEAMASIDPRDGKTRRVEVN